MDSCGECSKQTLQDFRRFYIYLFHKIIFLWRTQTKPKYSSGFHDHVEARSQSVEHYLLYTSMYWYFEPEHVLENKTAECSEHYQDKEFGITAFDGIRN